MVRAQCLPVMALLVKPPARPGTMVNGEQPGTEHARGAGENRWHP
jgi:hypothetical protein